MGSMSARFFDFQSQFLAVFERMHREVLFTLEKLRSGVRKMEETDAFLRTMHDELEALRPQLEVKALHALQLERKLKVRSSHV